MEHGTSEHRREKNAPFGRTAFEGGKIGRGLFED
jgi:hypothetical protein